MSIARKFYYPGKVAGMDPIDVVQEANCGLIQAAITFRYGRGASFISYAHSRIEGQIKDAIRKVVSGKGIGRNIERTHRRITEVTMALFDVLGRPPTNEEIANHLQISVEELAEITRAMALITQSPLPLDAQLVDFKRSDAKPLDEVIEDIHATDALEAIVRRENQKELREVMNEILSQRERFILVLYYQMVDDKRKWSFKEIGLELGISESRTCQLASRAMAKLGAHPKIVQWHAKLPALDPKIQTTLTVFEMARRQDESERRRIYNDWKERTVLFEEVG